MFKSLKKLNPLKKTGPLRSSGPPGLDGANEQSRPSRGQEGMNPGPLSSDAISATDPENEVLDSIRETDSYGIKILYNPSSAILDIVFVHGLTGSAFSTWFHEDSSKHWPRDLVKNDISDARVMTFGYDADVARFWGQAAQDGISGYANDLLGKLARKRQRVDNRKIVFVAHSLGGLVTQRALTISRESRFPHLQGIEACTVGICFLGTPHHGADLAKWGSILTNIVNIAKPANSAPVRLLERDSEMLRDVQDGFHNLLEKRKDEGAKIRITCFYETLPLVRLLVVPKDSAVISGELSYPIRANHIDMTKFSSREAPGYEDVIGEIQRLASDDSNYTHLRRRQTTQPNLATEAEHHRRSTPSLPEDTPGNSISNYGSGTINANTSEGTQNNNTGSGKQYIGQNQYFKED